MLRGAGTIPSGVPPRFSFSRPAYYLLIMADSWALSHMPGGVLLYAKWPYLQLQGTLLFVATLGHSWGRVYEKPLCQNNAGRMDMHGSSAYTKAPKTYGETTAKLRRKLLRFWYGPATDLGLICGKRRSRSSYHQPRLGGSRTGPVPGNLCNSPPRPPLRLARGRRRASIE